VHLKDTAVGAGVKKDVPAAMGFGVLDNRSIMEALLKVQYKGQAGLEYELESPDPVPGIAQSYGYMRGMLAALSPVSQS
jgi:sugar phosphate isomerase/epimerase